MSLLEIGEICSGDYGSDSGPCALWLARSLLRGQDRQDVQETEGRCLALEGAPFPMDLVHEWK